MNIEVIGGGALGLLFAAGAALGGADTVLYARTDAQARTIADRGISWSQGGQEETQRRIRTNLEARPISAFGGSGRGKCEERWILLAVKQKDLSPSFIARLTSGVYEGDRVLCLQNGIGHLERLAEALPQAAIYAAITTEGARRPEPDTVVRAGLGSTVFGIPGSPAEPGEYRNEAEKKLAETFQAGGLALSASNEIETAIYRKLVINAVINPLTAIWRIENGRLPESLVRIDFMRKLFDETLGVYSAAGVPASEEWWEELLGVCRSTALNRSSMLEDVSRGRETEAKWIGGGIAALARRSGTEAPLNEMLVHMIEGMR
ncbi:2-dehydropantoate 2-reductase [Saccharibacillus qingshengii]|uniref:2-dehydropantoate 2-reductase n=1 Tax=Saccharibacillus qingshengii TaxID=1763540 RepID=UPI001554C0B7